MEVQQIGQATIVKLIERVDTMTSPEVESSLQAVLTGNPPQLILDCTATKYMSSAGLRVVLVAAKALKKGGGQLALVCPKGNFVDEVLELTGITHFVPVFETVEQAIARLS